MCKTPRIDELRHAVRDYGRTAVETETKLRRLGGAIIGALRTYLHPEKTLVFGAPPHGDWEPETDYRDAAFSTFYNGPIRLGPVEMGVSVRIDNLGDDGAVWLRLLMTLRKVGDTLRVGIDDLGTVCLPLAFEDKLEPVCDMVFNVVRKLFTEDVEHDRRGDYGGGAIGFLTPKAG